MVRPVRLNIIHMDGFACGLTLPLVGSQETKGAGAYMRWKDLAYFRAFGHYRLWLIGVSAKETSMKT